MQTVNQTINDLSYVLGIPRTRVNTIARVLINAGILPKSAGRDIRKIDAVQLCGFVAALAMADKADQAVETAEAIMNLPLSGDAKGGRFKAAFAENISTAETKAAPKLTFSRLATGLTAELAGSFIHDGSLSSGVLPYWINQTWGGWTQTSFTLAPEGFVIMRNLFNRPYDNDAQIEYRRAG